MTTAQCLTGAVWAACAVDIYATLGTPGVAAFAAISGLIGVVIYRKLFKKGHTNDA